MRLMRELEEREARMQEEIERERTQVDKRIEERRKKRQLAKGAKMNELEKKHDEELAKKEIELMGIEHKRIEEK